MAAPASAGLLGSVLHVMVNRAVAADPEGKLWADLGVRYQPTWIFVNGTDGKVTTEFGDFEGAALRSRFDALIAR